MHDVRLIPPTYVKPYVKRQKNDAADAEVICKAVTRPVDYEGKVLDAFVSKRRDRKAALKFLRKLMNRYGRPEHLVTDRLRSYGAAMKGHRQS